MRISNIYSTQGVTRPAAVAAKGKAERVQKREDTFTPSSLAADFNVVRRAVAASPDIRADKIDDIINRLKAGEYNVSAEDVSKKILDQIG